MRTLRVMTHTEWASTPESLRRSLDQRLAAGLEILVGRLHYEFRLMKAEPKTIAAIQARLTPQAIALELYADVGLHWPHSAIPLPPFWTRARWEDDTVHIDFDVPCWRHDCDQCAFLGRVDGHDLYACSRGPLPTFIARYGDGGHYKSGGAFVGVDPEITEAFRRWKEGR